MKAILFPMLVVMASLAPPSIRPASAQIAGQPREEIAAQKLLPKVRDPLWAKLADCKVSLDEKHGTFAIQMTPEVKALDGQKVTIRGFVLPLDGSDQTQHFLVTRNTPVCLYCPPGEPNEVVEVMTARPVGWSSKIMTFTGTLRLINDKEQALFFRIEKAEAH